jgi:hypothetical protein
MLTASEGVPSVHDSDPEYENLDLKPGCPASQRKPQSHKRAVSEKLALRYVPTIDFHRLIF